MEWSLVRALAAVYAFLAELAPLPAFYAAALRPENLKWLLVAIAWSIGKLVRSPQHTLRLVALGIKIIALSLAVSLICYGSEPGYGNVGGLMDQLRAFVLDVRALALQARALALHLRALALGGLRNASWGLYTAGRDGVLFVWDHLFEALKVLRHPFKHWGRRASPKLGVPAELRAVIQERFAEYNASSASSASSASQRQQKKHKPRHKRP